MVLPTLRLNFKYVCIFAYRAGGSAGAALGGPVLLALRIQDLSTERTRRTLHPQPQTRLGSLGPGGCHLARTEVSLRATIQTANTATGWRFPIRTVTARPFSERTSPRSQALFPPEGPLRERALARVRTRILRLVAPWGTRHRILFFDDAEFGLREAFLALKAGDRPGAMVRSRQALEAIRAHPGASPLILGRASFNLGICRFLLGR